MWPGFKLGLQESLSLGPLDSRRDWGFAGDYVKGDVPCSNRTSPMTIVLATGETHSIRELLDQAFAAVGSTTGRPRSSRTTLPTPAEVYLLQDILAKVRLVQTNVKKLVQNNSR